MSNTTAKDHSIIVGALHLTECPNGDCDIRVEEWRYAGTGHKRHTDYHLHIPKADRNAIAEFLKV